MQLSCSRPPENTNGRLNRISRPFVPQLETVGIYAGVRATKSTADATDGHAVP